MPSSSPQTTQDTCFLDTSIDYITDKSQSALGCPRTLCQVPSLGPAMLPEEKRGVRASTQNGFHINGLHNQSHESSLKRHAISRTGLKKKKRKKKSQGDL